MVPIFFSTNLVRFGTMGRTGLEDTAVKTYSRHAFCWSWMIRAKEGQTMMGRWTHAGGSFEGGWVGGSQLDETATEKAPMHQSTNLALTAMDAPNE